MKKLFVAALALGLLLLAAATAFWRAGENSSPQIVRLSDGSELSLDEISFDVKHSYHFGSAWKRLLSVLPPAISSRLGKNVSSVAMYSGQPSLGLWCRWKNKNSQSLQIEFMPSDEGGFESHSEGSSYSYGSTSTESIEGRTFAAFPRRGRLITICIYERDAGGGRKKKGAFTIKNPSRASFPTWTAERLPSAKKDGNLEVTLTRLLTAVDDNREKKVASAKNTPEGWALACFRILENGQPATNWSPTSLEMTDATGNTLASGSWSCATSGDEKRFHFRWTLWPDGTPWKIRAEFSRESRFAENETCTFKGIPIPRAGAFFQTNLESKVLDSTIRFHGVSGDGAVLPGNFPLGNGSPGLHVQVHPVATGSRLTLVSVVDDAGRIVSLSGSGNSGGLYSYGLKIPRGAKTLDVTFALHKSRYVEFIAQPDASGK